MPLPESVAEALKEHMKHFPPVEVTLPWMRASGQPVTKRLIVSGPRDRHVWRTSLNEDHWKPILARIKAVSEYLGHSDPGLTLKVYAHLVPSSRDRARNAIGHALRPQEPGR